MSRQFKKKPPFYLVFSWAPTLYAFDFTLGWCEELPKVVSKLTNYLTDTKGPATELVFKGNHV